MEKDISRIREELIKLARHKKIEFAENEFITVSAIVLGSSKNIVILVYPFKSWGEADGIKYEIHKIFSNNGMSLSNWRDFNNNRICSEANYQ